MTGPEGRPSSRDTTEYLRGVAIVVVVVSHFVLSYHHDFYQRYLFEYASVALAIFFVLSGFGISRSLAARTGGGPASGTTLARFFFDRAFRIYPPYWLALVVLTLFPAAVMLREPSAATLAIYLGSPRAFWFVTAIIQCYVAAPFLYSLLRRLGPMRFWWLSLAMLGMSLFGSYFLFISGGVPENSLLAAFMYRQYFLGNIVLFSFGMLVPWLLERFGERLDNGKLLLALLVACLAGLHFGRFGFVFYPLFVLASLFFCAAMIATRPPLPFARLVMLLGRDSYSLYLFHRIYFMVLAAAGLLAVDSTMGIFFTVLLTPLLLLFCSGVEHAVASTHRRVSGIVWGEEHIDRRGGAALARDRIDQ